MQIKLIKALLFNNRIRIKLIKAKIRLQIINLINLKINKHQTKVRLTTINLIKPIQSINQAKTLHRLNKYKFKHRTINKMELKTQGNKIKVKIIMMCKILIKL